MNFLEVTQENAVRIYFAVIALMVVLTGCSTNLTPSERARAVPSDRVMFAASDSAELGQIVVTRDAGLLGSACYLGVYVNGQLSARIGRGETVSFAVDPGNHLVGMGSDPDGKALCAINIPIREVSAEVEAGKKKKYRIYGDMSAGFSISPTSF